MAAFIRLTSSPPPTWAADAPDQTWEIRDIDGSNVRRVTLAQFRAEVDAAKAKAEAIYLDQVCAEYKRRPS